MSMNTPMIATDTLLVRRLATFASSWAWGVEPIPASLEQAALGALEMAVLMA